MDIKDVLKLTEMGWTKDEILALSGSAAELSHCLVEFTPWRAAAQQTFVGRAG